MPARKAAISSRVTVENPRPRKYASAAERQKALRERFPTLCVRVEQEQADFMKRIADEQGRTLQDVHLAFIKYANGRGNLWLTQGLKGFAPLPRFEEPKENPMKRKPTPAQIAARERFAEMARSGAFKRKAKRNPAKKTVSRNPRKKKSDDFLQYEIKRANEHFAKFYGFDPDLIELVGIRANVLQAEGLSQTEAFKQAELEAKTKTGAFSYLKTNPRAANPIILVSDKPIKTRRKSNPAKAKRQRMLNISWLTAGGQREIMSVPIEFVFTHYVGNVAEKFFVRTENGQLIVSEYSTGGRIGQVPYTMRAAALNDREAAKRYVAEMLSKIGAERFKTAVKKFDPIN